MLLSYLSDAEIAAYLESAGPLDSEAEIFTDTIGMTAQTAWDDIASIRGKNYITWGNPRSFGGAYIAFPALDDAGRPHAIVTVGGPIERFSMDRVDVLCRHRGRHHGAAAAAVPAVPGGANLAVRRRVERERAWSAIVSSSARRTLHVLETIGHADRPLGVTEIGRQLGISAGTVFRGLDALERGGISLRDIRRRRAACWVRR